MKMKPEHYKHIETQILDICFDNDVVAMEQCRVMAYERQGLTNKRFRWDLLYMAGLSTWICDNLYTYLDDDQIDTALRKITNTRGN